MSRALRVLATLAFGSLLGAEGSGSYLAPSYSSASIVNSASFQTAALSPNTIASIFGTDLSYGTGGVSDADIGSGFLPLTLAGVRVFVAGIPASLYYVSPSQINFLIPAELLPGNVALYVAREGTRGPFVTLTLVDAFPGLYQSDAKTIVATHADGSLVIVAAPAQGGEVVILYGTGLGRTDPDVISGQFSKMEAPIQRIGDLHVFVAGTALDPQRIQYAGAAPGIPGVYLVTVRLPDRIPANPEVRLAMGDQTSPPSITLPATGSATP
jgi:uncharacterized protein (TIGR03437 family)